MRRRPRLTIRPIAPRWPIPVSWNDRRATHIAGISAAISQAPAGRTNHAAAASAVQNRAGLRKNRIAARRGGFTSSASSAGSSSGAISARNGRRDVRFRIGCRHVETPCSSWWPTLSTYTAA